MIWMPDLGTLDLESLDSTDAYLSLFVEWGSPQCDYPRSNKLTNEMRHGCRSWLGICFYAHANIGSPQADSAAVLALRAGNYQPGKCLPLRVATAEV
jgi:hypothetical protein